MPQTEELRRWLQIDGPAMKSAMGLNRQLVIWMAAVTGVALAVMIAGMVLFYASVEHIDATFWDKDWNSYWPQPIEWAAFIAFWVLGLAGAIAAAVLFTRRLIGPLEAVGSAARRIARGDLTAHAAPQGKMFDETRQLVEDFNAMAGQLQRAEAEMRAWNVAIAHELRTPLTILRGRLQGYVDEVFTPDVSAFRSLLAQVDSLTRIAEDLKVVTLAQGGRLELRLESIDLADEVAAVIPLVAPELSAAGVTVAVDLGKVQIRADGARVRQALLALLENVRRHAAPGTVRIETRATLEAAILRVCDDGPGLPPGAEERVFEPFWRADSSRSRASGGSGLGLAVVQAIAKAHGGTAFVRAENPKGAIFEIHLPRGSLSLLRSDEVLHPDQVGKERLARRAL